VVHEIRGQGIGPLEFGDDVLTADDKSRPPVPKIISWGLPILPRRQSAAETRT